MGTHDTYNLILCLIVLIALTALFSVLITIIIRYALKTINAGLDDEKIKKEYIEEQNKKKNRFFAVLSNTLPILVCAILACVLCFSLYSRFTQNSKVGAIPTLKAVASGSMETKHKENTYLEVNNLNDQIKTFDLIVLHQLPKEEDLKLYDIVVYEANGYFIIHRIVGIEEPNASHPDERWFVLRGDANKYADEFPVTYNQMCSIYRGETIPIIGPFVMFMQSPAGIICFVLVVLVIITLPLIEKKLKKAIVVRQIALGLIPNENGEIIATADEQHIENERIVDNTIGEEVATTEEQAVNTADEEIIAPESPKDVDFDGFNKIERKTFEEKLALIGEEKTDWYNQLVYVLMQIPAVRRSQAKYHELYRQKNNSIAKISIKGKSIYVYLPVNAEDYQGVQYGFKNVSNVKAHGKLISECKITSNRKLKNVLKILATYGENVNVEMPKDSENQFALRKKLTLKQKLFRLPKERKVYYKEIVALMGQKANATRWESKSSITYKQGRKPLLKITVKGKSVYVYLAVNPADYTGAKYGIKDVSNVKTYRDYPAQCKITSDRKLKYLKTIINEKI